MYWKSGNAICKKIQLFQGKPRTAFSAKCPGFEPDKKLNVCFVVFATQENCVSHKFTNFF